MPEGFTITIKGKRQLWCDDWQCQKCGKVEELTLERGEEPGPCECGGERKVIIDKPKPWEFGKPKGDDRIIWHDKQIESSHGKNWRETNKRPHKEGGAGGSQYYDRGAGRYNPVT